MPPLSPTRQYEPDSKTAPASTSPLGIRVDASAVRRRRKLRWAGGPTSSCPPRLPLLFFLHDFAPPPPSRLSRCAAASIATPTPVSLRLSCASGWLLHCHLSRCASASLVVPAPLSLHRHLSRCAAASLVAPHLRRLVVASRTILTCRHLSCRVGWLLPCYLSLCAAVSLFATSLIALPSL
jgi:hypothetical protein